MKILVTGASGLLGSRIVELAIASGYKVYSGFYTHHVDMGIPIKLNILDVDNINRVISHVNPDVVIHSAALTNVDLCERDRDLAYRVNVLGTKNLVKALRGDVYIIYISTDYVFDGVKGLYREDDEPNPINYYGYTKLLAEELILEKSNEYLIVRPSVIYGYRVVAGKTNFALWLYEMLSRGRVVKLITDQFVSPTLNTNLARMVLEALERRLTGIYHMAGGERISRYGFGVKFAEIFNFDHNLIVKATMDELDWLAKRPRDASLDVSKAYKILRNKPLNVYDSLNVFKRELRNVTGGCG